VNKILSAAIAILLVAVAHAEEGRVPEEIRSCAPLRNNAERLACFDRAVSFLTSSHAEGAALPPPSAESMFGIKSSEPSKKETEHKDERKQVEGIRAKIKNLSFGSDGAIIELDNGQTWHQISGGALLLKTGDEVKIARGALSSFNITVPSGRIAKVRRVQ